MEEFTVKGRTYRVGTYPVGTPPTIQSCTSEGGVTHEYVKCDDGSVMVFTVKPGGVVPPALLAIAYDNMPKGCDPTRWKAVVDAVFADHFSGSTKRPDLAGYMVGVECAVRAYHLARFEHGVTHESAVQAASVELRAAMDEAMADPISRALHGYDGMLADQCADEVVKYLLIYGSAIMPQPFDTLTSLSVIPPECLYAGGGINPTLLLRWAVPTLSEERAEGLGKKLRAEVGRDPLTVAQLQVFVAKHAPDRR